MRDLCHFRRRYRQNACNCRASCSRLTATAYQHREGRSNSCDSDISSDWSFPNQDARDHWHTCPNNGTFPWTNILMMIMLMRALHYCAHHLLRASYVVALPCSNRRIYHSSLLFQKHHCQQYRSQICWQRCCWRGRTGLDWLKFNSTDFWTETSVAKSTTVF